MELWDVYDINKRFTGKVIDRHSDERLKEGEYHLVVEAIIINCIKGENSLQSMLREIREELGVIFNESDAVFYKTLRDDNAKDFKDIWLFRKDLEIKDLSYTDGEVVDSKWITIDEFEKMIDNEEIIPTIDFDKEDYKKCLEL